MVFRDRARDKTIILLTESDLLNVETVKENSLGFKANIIMLPKEIKDVYKKLSAWEYLNQCIYMGDIRIGQVQFY